MTITFRNPLETPTIIHLHFTGNDKGLYATMRGGRIDPSSCQDTCWMDDIT